MRLSVFPWRLWHIVKPDASRAEKEQVAQDFFDLPECCLGYFCKRLRIVLPTPAALMGPQGLAIIHVWLRTLLWSTYNVEKEHGACRRLASGCGPARNFTLVSRERLLESVRSVHLEKVCFDPAHEGSGAYQCGKLALAMQAHAEAMRNPLAAPISSVQVAGAPGAAGDAGGHGHAVDEAPEVAELGAGEVGEVAAGDAPQDRLFLRVCCARDNLRVLARLAVDIWRPDR